MTWFARMIDGFRSERVTGSPTPWGRAAHRVVNAPEPAAGEFVSEGNAVTYSAVFRATQYIADLLSDVECAVLRRVSTNTVERVPDHPIYALLNGQSNPEMDARSYRVAEAVSLVLWGNAYAEVERTVAGDPLWVWPIHPARVSLRRANTSIGVAGATGDFLYYEVSDSGDPGSVSSGAGSVDLPLEDMIHSKGISPDGLLGYSVVGLAREAISMGLASEGFGAAFFGNDARPSFVLSHPQELSDSAQARIEKSLRRRFGGARRSWRPFVLEEGMKLEPLSVPPKDAQFLETREHQINDIARWFGVPPHVLFDLRRATFSNIEAQDRTVVRDALMPRATAMEAARQWKLIELSPGNRGEGLFVRHQLKELIRGDLQSQARFFEVMWRIGVYSINEIRAFLDENPIDNGNTHFVMLNMAPLDQMATGQVQRSRPAAGGVPNAAADPDQVQQSQFAVVTAAHDRVLRKEQRAAGNRWGRYGLQGWSEWLNTFATTQTEFLVEQLEPIAEGIAALVRPVAGAAVSYEAVRAHADRYRDDLMDRLGAGAEAQFELEPLSLKHSTRFLEDLVEDLVREST